MPDRERKGVPECMIMYDWYFDLDIVWVLVGVVCCVDFTFFNNSENTFSVCF